MFFPFYKFLLVVSLLFTSIINAYTNKNSDSLLNNSYKELTDKYYKYEYLKEGLVYIKAYLEKAKLENNTKSILKGYHFYADFYDTNYKKATVYIDSAIVIAEKTNFKNKFYPAALYGKKAYIERIEGNFTVALDLYLKELKLFKKSNNNYNINFTKYNIGLLKRDYGDFEGAKTIFKNHLKFIKKTKCKTHNKVHLSTCLGLTYELSRTYRLNNEIDSASIINSEGLKIATNNKAEYYLVFNDGILDFYKGEYHSCINKISSTLSKLENVSDRVNYEIYNLIDAYLFLGKSYEALSKNKKALQFYKKTDSLTVVSNYLVPETKEVYSKLINHYKIINDSKNQLISVNKLLQIDSILDRNYKYINNKLEYDYDRPNLIKEKELLIRSLQNNNSDQSKTNWILISCLLMSLMGFSLVYYKKIINTKRFEYKLKNNNTKSENTIEKINIKSIVTKEVSIKILSELQNFDNKKAYLKPNLNLNKVAKTLNTNSKYLSIVINQTYNKSVVQYINDLRIEYVILKLKEDQKFRKYTIKAIAIEIGFNTDQAFSKAFHKKTGVFPSSFIKELNN